jgi:hypothetical protein
LILWLFALVLLAAALPLEAQQPGGRPAVAVEERAYTLPYAATITMIALGLVAVCMPTLRRRSVEVDDEE